MDARLSIRDRIQNKDIAALKGTFGTQFDYVTFNRASERTDERLGEDPQVFRSRSWELRRKQQSQRQIDHPVRRRSRSLDLER